uniref:GTPase Der n=1 Tax=Candidatus Kentrum sp. LFY TaxID=2126342 RepID=A0A450V055_9GAMM|nr:MAG: GTP-binding protein [Candidatus Kentron sp. LFY]
MLPVVAIVGRPNVGKSTLFNCLTRSRDALVANEPGLTRDRQYGTGKVGHAPYLVIDTGGLTDDPLDLSRLAVRQTLTALGETDVALFLVDARQGLTPTDQEIASLLRPFGTSIVVVANKIDGLDQRTATADFHALGLGDPWPIAAAHGRGVTAMMADVTARFLAPTEKHTPSPPEADLPQSRYSDEEQGGTRVAIIGRPNVGKSTLVNHLLGETRVVVHDHPGTTRDSIAVPLIRGEKSYVLVDTAGIRRRARVSEKIEKFSIVKSLQSIEAADVTILLIDAQEGITDQDLHLIGFIVDAGRALVIGVNKWDAVPRDSRKRIHAALERKLPFVDFITTHTISARTGFGVASLFRSVDAAWRSASRTLSTPLLTTILHDAVARHPPPLVRRRRIKLRYAHQGGRKPPIIVVHGNQTGEVPESYRRYLAGAFRDALQLTGTPIRVQLKTGENPYKEKRNLLTPRQVRKRARLLKHVKKK